MQVETLYFKRTMYETMISIARFRGNQFYLIEYNEENDLSTTIESKVFTTRRNEVLHNWIKDSQSKHEDTEVITITEEEFMRELIKAQHKLAAIAA